MSYPIYKAYNFRTKDPEVDILRTLIEDHFGHRINHKSIRQITEGGGPSQSAMSSWFFGKTLRPQNATLEAAGRAIGYRRVWKKEGK